MKDLRLSIIHKYNNQFILHSFWVIGMCWNMCTTNQWGWKIWVVLASISPWQALVSFNQTSRSGFPQKLVISIMYLHFPSWTQPILLYGIHSLKEVSFSWKFQVCIYDIKHYMKVICITFQLFIFYNLVELASLILGTDYGRWAVLAQCNRNPSDRSTRYLSTR